MCRSNRKGRGHSIACNSREHKMPLLCSQLRNAEHHKSNIGRAPPPLSMKCEGQANYPVACSWCDSFGKGRRRLLIYINLASRVCSESAKSAPQPQKGASFEHLSGNTEPRASFSSILSNDNLGTSLKERASTGKCRIALGPRGRGRTVRKV